MTQLEPSNKQPDTILKFKQEGLWLEVRDNTQPTERELLLKRIRELEARVKELEARL